ncbi:type II secretion system protein GspM [Trichloromonas sp.]|uniref:type II secretion system protein GspM n=1 Tax=Trichloromonas sp. TaxID=3069249 RepID=UPI002A46375D|nr:type II secretion system protein GspM [Trichloromonas sp.]
MFQQLSQRERLILLAGGLFLLAVLTWFAVISPYRQAMDGLDGKIGARQQQLAELRNMQEQYFELKQSLDRAERQMEQATTFSIFAFMENLAARHVDRANLVSMRPQPALEREGFREESVEIKLERVALGQLVGLLRDMETAESPLQVKSLRIKTRFDDKRRLDSVLTVAAYGRNR